MCVFCVCFILRIDTEYIQQAKIRLGGLEPQKLMTTNLVLGNPNFCVP